MLKLKGKEFEQWAVMWGGKFEKVACTNERCKQKKMLNAQLEWMREAGYSNLACKENFFIHIYRGCIIS